MLDRQVWMQFWENKPKDKESVQEKVQKIQYSTQNEDSARLEG
jgi:hypothetical protein